MKALKGVVKIYKKIQYPNEESNKNQRIIPQKQFRNLKNQNRISKAPKPYITPIPN